MSIFQAIILGIVQGVGEFLPISSSAHLILVRYLFNFPVQSESFEAAFDVALHFGTLLAVIFVFWKDWINLIYAGIIEPIKRKFSSKGNSKLEKNNKNTKKSFSFKMFWYLVCATIPGALFGVLFGDVIEDKIRSNMVIIAILLAVMGILIYLGDKWSAKKYKNPVPYEKLKFKHTFLIGMSQALAIIPGFSRSGTTILTARLMGVSREAATKFTFLLSTPIIFGAAVVKIKDLFGMFDVSIIIGIITAAIVGVISIKFLLKYIRKNDFAVFAYYRVIIAIIVLVKVLIVR